MARLKENTFIRIIKTLQYTVMRILFTFFFVMFLAVVAFTQSKLNVSLAHELDSMVQMDQKYRQLLMLERDGKSDSLAKLFHVKQEDIVAHLWKLQKEVDSSNLSRLEDIIKEHGYPGMSLVGAPTNEAAFFIIQHSPKIDLYLPVIKKAAEEFELSFSLYAMMLDRSLVQKDEEQVYGTQGIGVEIPNPATGKRELTMIIWPIKDAANVNMRRREAGFDLTIEEYALQLLRTEYKPYTLEEVLWFQKLN
ncbi:MAG: hypothetical protein GXC73_16710 [Chitinophagaceae bacterium]|nr:hypothetical protein [Chitinophagaceae bacterium]